MNKKILIADDHYIVRAGTAAILELEYPDIEIYFATRYDEVKTQISSVHFDLVLLDIDMPGTLYTHMIGEIKLIQPDIKILIFSAFEKETVLQYIHEGADGYLNKKSEENEIKNAVETMFRIGVYYPQELIPFILKNTTERTVVKSLSPREYQIFKLLAEGNGNLEISNILGIQKSTISTLKKRIFEKLKVRNTVELAEFHKRLH
nr:response regulator transcription factor [uncultured Chryseobacterium sp.]